jgi:type III secretion protein J
MIVKGCFRHFSWFLLAFLTLTLVGCGRVPLFSGLGEDEANEMMARLMEKNVECVKVPGKEDKWVLEVTQEDFPLAIQTLESIGLPRHKTAKMSEVFQKSGLVSSPTEERIRFISALSEELAETLTKIDGVIAARVHISLPNNDPLSDRSTPASAAVFIKYRAGYDVESSTPDIKNLVTKSVEGLTFENVELVMTPTEMEPPQPKQMPVGSLAARLAALPTWALPAASGLGGFAMAALMFVLFRKKQTV